MFYEYPVYVFLCFSSFEYSLKFESYFWGLEVKASFIFTGFVWFSAPDKGPVASWEARGTRNALSGSW